MPSNVMTHRALESAEITAVGIDVGGEQKGFHAVALIGGSYACQFTTKDVPELSRWCRKTIRPLVIAIDAPCRWSDDGRARPAERALMKQGISCFSTPTLSGALEHPANYFGWMLRGAELFHAIEEEFPLCRIVSAANRKCCFETFPHAITWYLRGGNANASHKRTQRRAVLKQAGIDINELTTIDLVDAALCALAASFAAAGKECVGFGEQKTGLIIVPNQRKADPGILP